MNDIAEGIEQLARHVEREPSEVRIWTTFSLASRLGLEAILSSAPDPVQAVVEVGELWTDQVAEVLEGEPHRQADTLRAARAVIKRLLTVVPGDDHAQAARRH